MSEINSGLLDNPNVIEVTNAAEECVCEYQAALEDKYGDILLGIEDEFVVQGINYREYESLLNFLTKRLNDKYGEAFSSIDHEHPLMRVKDSVAAGQNGALHIPDLFRLELVTNHEPQPADEDDVPHVVNKARILSEMRRDIWEAVEEYSPTASVSWNPRPITDIYTYLTKSSNMHADDALADIKQQAEDNEDLIGRDQILEANTLEDLLLVADAPINNAGAAGSGVHINIGFKGKDGINPFYNPDNPDAGTEITWNSSAGIIDITAESILPFINLTRSSWKRIGNPHLSTAEEARYHPLKKGGAIVQQSPLSKEFYEGNGVPYKMTVNEKNAHIEVRHTDGGAGPREGSSLITLQLAATMAGMYHGLQEHKIHSYEELMEYTKPLAEDYGEAVARFQSSNLYRKLLGERLHTAVLEYVEDSYRKLEETWTVNDPDIIEIDEQELSYS